MKRQLRDRHPGIVLEFTVFETRIRDGLVRERVLATLSGVFGGLAALLAMVGLYGMVSYSVAQRRQEIGVRVALGARAGQVLAMVMREAVALLVTGVVAGLGLSWLVTRSAGTLLFGLGPRDPLTLLSATLFLAAIASVASFVPARRASRLDPLIALRQE
jgi:putative ABC transport system permease protein